MTDRKNDANLDLSSGIAYVVYGNFHWPPKPTSDTETKFAAGCLVVGYSRRDDKANKKSGWIAWLPNEEDLEIFSELSDKLPENPSAGAKFWQNFQSNLKKIVWIDQNLIGSASFRGAFLIESYTKGKSIDIRWPLLNKFEFKRRSEAGYTGVHHSEVVIKASKISYILGLPMAVQQFSWKGQNWTGENVFAWTVDADTTIEDGSNTKLFSRAYLGIPKGLAAHYPLNDENNHLEKYLPEKKFRTIGGVNFGIANRRKKEGYENYVHLDDDDLNGIHVRFFPTSHPGIDWTDQNRSILKHLGSLGLRVPNDDQEPGKFIKALESTKLPPDKLSLSFTKAKGDNDEQLRGFKYIITQEIVGNVAESDLTFEGSSLCINLSNEIENKLRLNSKQFTTTTEILWNANAVEAHELLRVCKEKHIDYVELSEILEPKMTAELSWDDTGGSGVGNSTRDIIREVLDDSDSSRNSLLRIEGAQPQSFLPKVGTLNETEPIQCALFAKKLNVKFNSDGFFDWHNPEALTDRKRFNLSLSRESKLKTVASFPSLGSSQQDFSNIELLLKFDKRASQQTSHEDEFLFLKVETENSSRDRKFTGAAFRLGTIEMQVVADFIDSSNTSSEGSALIASYISEKVKGQGASRFDTALHLNLKLKSVEPVTVDISRDEEDLSDSSILISESKNKQSEFVLAVTEKIQNRDDWKLEAEIYEGNGNKERSSADESYVLLGFNPLSIQKFYRKPLQNLGDNENAIVAVYSSSTRAWQFRKGETYHYMLPAQAVGEGSDKPRMHEIHDPTSEDESIVPYPVEQVEGEVKLLNDIATYLVDFRLTPPAELFIRPSDTDRNYYLPEWAAYRLFRQKSELGLGVPLEGFIGEFLYGLSVGIDPSKEDGRSSLARVAEFDALMGRAKQEVAITDDDRYVDQLHQRWLQVSKALASRPERLELWVPEVTGHIPFKPASFSKGAQFTLRNTALHRHPTEIEDYRIEPHTIDIDGAKQNTSNDISSDTPRYHPRGLPGGALWPLESKNFFEELLRNPNSTGGQIENIVLSPGGGGADQTAEYLNGVVKIISQTRNGFVQRQRIEITGRIAPFWHKAKHVVVFERTVNASDQFAPETNGKSRSRRAILRKVSEYVEVLEPIRKYPDFEEVSTRAAGFLESVRFNTKTINVDSAWSEDVDDNGWKIPLWNRYSSRIRPKVYPLPAIGFTTISEGKDEDSVVTQECLDPDNIYFYSEVTDNSDTDTWRARSGIDYAQVGEAGAIIEELNRDAEVIKNQSHTPRASVASRYLPGYRNFTWRLAPAAKRTMLNASRGDKPIYAGLETVTFMRAQIDPQGLKSKEIVNFVGESVTLSKHINEVEKSVPQLWKDDSYPTEIWEERAKFNELTGLLKTVEDSKHTKIRRVKNSIVAIWKELKPYYSDSKGKDSEGKDSEGKDSEGKDSEGKAIVLQKLFGEESATGNYLDKLHVGGQYKGLKDKKNKLLEGVSKAEKKCEQLAEQTVGEVKRKRRLIRERVASFVDQLEEDLIKLDNELPKNKEDFIASSVMFLKQELKDLLDPVRSDVSGVKEDIEKIRKVVWDSQYDLEEILKKLRIRVDGLIESYDKAKPWSDARCQELISKLSTEVKGVIGDVRQTIDEAREKFASELTDKSQQIGTIISASLTEEILKRVKVFNNLGDLTLLTSGADSIFLEIEGYSKSITSKLEILSKSSNSKYLDLANQINKDVTIKVNNIRKDIESVNNDLRISKDRFRASLLSKSQKSERKFEQLRRTMQNSITEFRKLIDSENDSIKNEFSGIFEDYEREFEDRLKIFEKKLEDWMSAGDNLYNFYIKPVQIWVTKNIKSTSSSISSLSKDIASEVDQFADGLVGQLEEMQNSLFDSNKGLIHSVATSVFQPVLEQSLEEVDKSLFKRTANNKRYENIGRLKTTLGEAASNIEEELETVSTSILSGVTEFLDTCNELSNSLSSIEEYLEKQADKYITDLKEVFEEPVGIIDGLIGSFNGSKEQAEKVLKELRAIDSSLKSVYNQAVATGNGVKAYSEQVLSSISRLAEDGFSAAPSNALRLYSAVTSSPEIAQLQTNIDRLRTAYREAENLIRCSKARAILSRIGDELKALGLDLPFDKLGEHFKIDGSALKNLNISSFIRNCGGIKLDGLFDGVGIPDYVREFIDLYIKVTHDFDEKRGIAWVQVDMNIPLDGKNKLFSVGPFKASFVNSSLKGQLRLEASKETDEVAQTGNSIINTDIEMVASGQELVTLQKVAIRYTKESGLKFDLDPKNIRINPAFKFVQDTLGSIFPDEVGGMQIVKRRGVPVGMMHSFGMPPVSLNFGTSGVSNISISNRFKLLAHPDFMISDSFNLSRPNQPFIFSIFIIGGTGYVQLNTDYRPGDKQLSVAVESGVGGSAALGFSLGPVGGGVSITLSIALRYHKIVGRSGGGLSISQILVINGNVTLWGIATIYLELGLRMDYGKGGRVNGRGNLSVKLKVSRFIKLKFRRGVDYKLRDGSGGSATQSRYKSVNKRQSVSNIFDKADRLNSIRN